MQIIEFELDYLKQYKKPIIYVILFLLSILIFFKFPGIYFLLVIIIFDKILNYLGKTNKFFKLGLENVTTTALVLGQITTLPIAIIGTMIMMFIDKIRDIKITFKGLFMDTIFWILFAVISSSIESNFVIIAIIMIIGRFTFFRVMQIINQESFEDLHKDFINLFYHIAFIKIFSLLFF